MRLDHLAVTDFRNYAHTEVSLPPGLTVVTGSNGTGKTNLLEAVAWLARLNSFRGAPPEAMIRSGSSSAVVRGMGTTGSREMTIETELTLRGRGRVVVNHQPLRRSEDLASVLRVSVFSPDDLELVKGAPVARRRYLDEGLAVEHPRHGERRRNLDRILRQRNALLRSAGGRATPEVVSTLDVWDSRLAVVGQETADCRYELVERLAPLVGQAYRALSGESTRVGIAYSRSWPEGMDLGEALAVGRDQDLRRGLSLVGPHRDELELTLADLGARLCASQGEQRSLALALRLGMHQLATDLAGRAPLLLLDDVFSELDPGRSEALVVNLPPGQAVLTTAGQVPACTRPDQTVVLRGDRLHPVGVGGG